LVAVAFAAVLFGWWSDRQRSEERLRRSEGLVAALRTADPTPFYWDELASMIGPDYPVLYFASTAELLTFVRTGSIRDQQLPSAQLYYSLAGAERGQATAGLLPLLDDEDAEVRIRAARVMRQVGELSPAIAPALISAMQDVSDDVRHEATSMMRSVVQRLPQGAEDATTIEALMDLLTDDDAQLRLAAAEVLRYAPSHKVILDRLIRAFQDETDDDARVVIARAVSGIHWKLSQR
jgi:HEAT repeat protein